MASGIALAVAVLFATAGVAATIREELFAASSLATCEARAEQLQLALLESQQYAAELRSLLAEYQAKHHKLPAKPTNFKAPSARSLVEMAAEEGELIVPSADVMQVLGDVSSQLAVKKHEAAVLEQAARIAAMMAAQAAEEQTSASEEKDEKDESFQKALEEYEKAEEKAEKEMEAAEEQMEEAKATSLKTIAAADTRLSEAEEKRNHAKGTLKLSTIVLNDKKPQLETAIKKANDELKGLVGQQAKDEAKLAEVSNIRDALAEELQKTKDDQDSQTQAALEELTSVETEWLQKIEVLSDKVDEAERKLSEASLSETATRSVSSKLELMKSEKAKAHKEAQTALQLYTMGSDEMETYQANVDIAYGWMTNCERKWFKGGLRKELMGSNSITAESVEHASKLQKPKDDTDVFGLLKTYFTHMDALKMDTTIFGNNFANYSAPMTTTFAAVKTETMKLANMACKYWAVTKGGETSASDDTACSLFINKECGGKC